MIADFIKNFNRKFPFLVFILIIIAIDQISKFYIRSIVENSTIIKLTASFSIVDVWNRGISFGLFQDFPYTNFIFIITNTIVVFALILLFFKIEKKYDLLIVSLIIGGACGNLIDRFLFNAVYDFIDISIKTYHWPAFNIADSTIFLGAALYFTHHLKKRC